MASLSYTNEHLAWQQRVSKELGTVAAFQKLRTPLSQTKRTFQSFSPRNHQQLGHLPNIKKKSQPPPKVVARPSTQGSLVSSRRPIRKTLDREITEVAPKRPIQQEEPLKRPVKRPVEQKAKKSIETKEFREPQQPLPVIQPEAIQEEDLLSEELDQVDDLPEDNPSEVSFKTTSSQRRYIQHLEELLRQEREKQQQLAKDIHSFKNSS